MATAGPLATVLRGLTALKTSLRGSSELERKQRQYDSSGYVRALDRPSKKAATRPNARTAAAGLLRDWGMEWNLIACVFVALDIEDPPAKEFSLFVKALQSAPNQSFHTQLAKETLYGLRNNFGDGPPQAPLEVFLQEPTWIRDFLAASASYHLVNLVREPEYLLGVLASPDKSYQELGAMRAVARRYQTQTGSLLTVKQIERFTAVPESMVARGIAIDLRLRAARKELTPPTGVELVHWVVKTHGHDVAMRFCLDVQWNLFRLAQSRKQQGAPKRLGKANKRRK